MIERPIKYHKGCGLKIQIILFIRNLLYEKYCSVTTDDVE